VVNEDDEFERIEREIKYKLDSTLSTVVADDYYWIPIDHTTPTGVKVLLLGRSGVATMGHYEHLPGTQFWTHWAPLPRKKP
jgi:hypothetical protein